MQRLGPKAINCILKEHLSAFSRSAGVSLLPFAHQRLQLVGCRHASVRVQAPSVTVVDLNFH
jgi:hypothetical protein